jgi:hypothetical protein
MKPHCGSTHSITKYACSLPAGHKVDHGAKCQLRHCGGYGLMHRWPR